MECMVGDAVLVLLIVGEARAPWPLVGAARVQPIDDAVLVLVRIVGAVLVRSNVGVARAP